MLPNEQKILTSALNYWALFIISAIFLYVSRKVQVMTIRFLFIGAIKHLKRMQKVKSTTKMKYDSRYAFNKQEQLAKYSKHRS